MTTFQDMSVREPTNDDDIPLATLAYMAAHSRHLAHELVLGAFDRSKLTKAEVARRLGCDKSQLGKLINTPSNLTVETLGQLLFAIDGSAPSYGQTYPLRAECRNYCEPDWLAKPVAADPAKPANSVTSGSTLSTLRFEVAGS